MAIIARLLNKTIDVERENGTPNASGEIQKSRSAVASSVSARIVENDRFGQGGLAEAGPIAASTHKVFTNGGHSVDIGDYVVDGSDEYYVTYVDKSPGGTASGDRAYHFEIFVTKRN